MHWDLILRCASWILLLWLFVLCTAQNIGDPYKILGVHRKASLAEIRKSYKQLAKEWHPDKNEKPNAEDRFVEIKQAYELLADSERRQAYDLHGITNEDDHLYKQRHDYSQYGRFSNDPFEDFFKSHYRSPDHDVSLLHKLSVTTRHFENNILEKSDRIPALVLFYTDWCFDCIRSANSWRRLVEALQPLGVTMATIQAAHESTLSKKLGIRNVPYLIYVIDKQVHGYKDGLSSLPKILEFMRWKFPYGMVKGIDDYNARAFISDFEDNKVKALIFEHRPTMRMRYLIAAYRYRDRVAFGFIDTSQKTTSNISAKFKVQSNMDTMVILKEDREEPAASVSTKEIPTETLNQLIEANQFLVLPRLSSQSVLERVCPVEWVVMRRVLCVVSVSERGDRGERVRTNMRSLQAQAHPRVRFAYVYPHSQQEFIRAITNGSGIDQNNLEHRIVVLWRRDTNRIQYEWLNESWPVDPNLSTNKPELREEIHKYQMRVNETKRSLQDMLKRLLKSNDLLQYESNVQELVEEVWPGGISEWLGAVGAWGSALVRGRHAMWLFSLVGTSLFVLAVGYLMARMVRLEEESVQRAKEEKRKQNGIKKNNNETQSELKLHELRVEKYNGLVRLLKPGCRTIVILVDMESRVQLLSKFHKIVWPYRKNKTLLFAYLMVERNVNWFASLLSQCVGSPLRLNGRNCVGTVLALNPHRKYFCVYHAKHPETTAAAKRMSRVTRSLRGSLDAEAGAFIGFDSDRDSSPDDVDDTQPLLVENLLDGLDNWLDRLFEGSTHRYYINYWPDMTTK